MDFHSSTIEGYQFWEFQVIDDSRTTRPKTTRPTTTRPRTARPTTTRPTTSRPMDNSPQGHLAPRTIRPTDISPHGQFAPRTIRPTDISPHGHFAPRTTRPMDNSPHGMYVHCQKKIPKNFLSVTKESVFILYIHLCETTPIFPLMSKNCVFLKLKFPIF